MHYHLEIIMPNRIDIKSAVEEVLKPFFECDDDKDSTSPKFWDWFVLGGRWSGRKLTAGLDKTKLDAFNEELNEAQITVSSLECGKRELNPKVQEQKVDAIWQKHFPEVGGSCPYFQHFNDPYGDSTGFQDVALLKDVHPALTADHVIIVDEDLAASFMVQTEMWNGVNFVETKWDGLVLSAVDHFKEKLKNYKPEHAESLAPEGDWICVTVDYHS